MENVQLQFYNSRTKSIDIFNHDKLIPINMYTCGPTVYDRVHLGNLKTFLWSDFVVSFLQAIGYQTNHIMNITDIDDKIVSRLPEQTYHSLIEFTTHYTNKFLEDIEKLGVKNYTESNIHKVTDNINSMEQFVLELINKGFAYETSDGSIYFDSTKIVNNPFYIENDIEGYESERNIIRAIDLKNPRDFVLWKVKDDRNLSFTFNGKQNFFPGWDVECCAICNKVLGKVHIKLGGCDLKNKHHCNEISQAESLNPEQKYGNYWIHFGFLNFNGDKMSKSIGNVKRLEDINHNHKLLRMYLLSKSWKNDIEYSDDEILLMKKDFTNLHLLYNKLSYKFYKCHKNQTKNYSGETEIYQNILNAISNNFDTHKGLQLLVGYVDKFMKVYLDEDMANKILTELNKVNNLFNILDNNLLQIDEQTLQFIELREELRKQKQFDQTDKMREELKKIFIFEDENTGFTLIKKID